MHQNLCLPVPRVHRTLENCPDPNALQSSFLFISEHLSPRKNYSGSPTNYQNKKSLIIIFLLSFGLVLSLFFCLSIEWTQTYVSIIIFRQFLTAAENNQIKKQKIYYNITSQKEKEPNIAYIHIQNCLFWVFGLTQNLLL